MREITNFICCVAMVLVCAHEFTTSSSIRLHVEAFSIVSVSLASQRYSLSEWTNNVRTDCKKSSKINRSTLLFAGKESEDASARALQEKAAELRREVEVFEASKREESDQLRKEVEDKQREKDELRLRYSAVVPILKGDGTISMERCDFPPRMTKMPTVGNDNDDNDGIDDQQPKRTLSRILAFQAPLPLGIVLGQDEELPLAQRPTTIDAVAEGSNGEAAGIRVGDCLRACTACQVTMEQPTWQLIAGGIGRPKTTRMMFGTDNKDFEEVMEAIASNAMDPEAREVWLVVERMEDDEVDTEMQKKIKNESSD